MKKEITKFSHNQWVTGLVKGTMAKVLLFFSRLFGKSGRISFVVGTSGPLLQFMRTKVLLGYFESCPQEQIDW
jgi:hypothetical protein